MRKCINSSVNFLYFLLDFFKKSVTVEFFIYYAFLPVSYIALLVIHAGHYNRPYFGHSRSSKNRKVSSTVHSRGRGFCKLSSGCHQCLYFARLCNLHHRGIHQFTGQVYADHVAKHRQLQSSPSFGCRSSLHPCPYTKFRSRSSKSGAPSPSTSTSRSSTSTSVGDVEPVPEEHKFPPSSSVRDVEPVPEDHKLPPSSFIGDVEPVPKEHKLPPSSSVGDVEPVPEEHKLPPSSFIGAETILQEEELHPLNANHISMLPDIHSLDDST